MSELEQRVVEAETRAEDAEDKVRDFNIRCMQMQIMAVQHTHVLRVCVLGLILFETRQDETYGKYIS